MFSVIKKLISVYVSFRSCDQVNDQGGVEEGESQEDTGGSNISNVSSLAEPIGTAGQERALREQERAFREQEGRRAGGGVRGGTQAVEKAQSEPTGHSRPGAGERSYKQALCEPLPRMTTRSMARQT